MSETRIHSALRAIATDLAASGSSYALVGGLAVSVRTAPRFTRDIDLAVTVNSDREAETLVRFLGARQYRISSLLEQETVNRLATVRLIPPGEPALVVDLLFASCGIEPEITTAAQPLEVLAGMVMRVATVAHLLAMKVLSRNDSRRPQDRMDLFALIAAATAGDLANAREALQTIQARGFHRGKDLRAEFDSLLVE